MLIIGVTLFILMTACMVAAEKFNKTALLNNKECSRIIKETKLLRISSVIETTVEIVFGLFGGLLFVNGIRASALFRQNANSAILIALAVVILVIGHKFKKRIATLNHNQEHSNFFTALTLFLIVLGVIAVDIHWIDDTVTSEQTIVTAVETVQLDSEIIPTMCIEGKGEVVAFCFINQDGISDYDTVPANQSHIEYIELTEPYLEKRVKSKVITAIYPDGKVETRVDSTWKEYIFYIQKEN